MGVNTNRVYLQRFGRNLQRKYLGHGAGILRYIGSYVISETTFTFASLWAQIARSASPIDSRAVV